MPNPPFIPSGGPSGGHGFVNGDPTNYDPSHCPSGGNATLYNDEFPGGVLIGGGIDPNCESGGGCAECFTGPIDSVAGNLVSFSDTTGHALADSGFSPADFDAAGAAATAQSNAEAYADAAVAAHEAASDPHPQYLTPAEADLLYDALGAAAAVGSEAVGGDLTGNLPNPQIAAGAIVNADVNAAAGIVESKLALNFPTHSNANDPSAGEKAALAGTSGTPGAGNKYVTDADPRNTDSRAPTGSAGGDLTGTYPNPTLAAIGAAAGPLGDATHAPVVTIDDKGRVTALSSVAITGTAPGGAAGGDLAGTYPNPTVVQAAGAFNFAGIISPSISSDQNDWNPTGLSGAVWIRTTPSLVSRTVTGLQGGVAGRVVIIAHVGSTSNTKLILANESASSSAANRFTFSDGNLVLNKDCSITLIYDGTSQRWRPLNNRHESQTLDTMVGSPAQGDVMYRNATDWVSLAAGTAGQYLQTGGAGANPAWADLGALVGVQVKNAGDTTYTPTAGTKRAFVIFCAGGGGGGASDWTSGTTAAGGGGGGGGGLCYYYVAAVSGTYTISIGTGGAGGVVGTNGGVGGTGNNSTFVDGGTTVTANGGVGGAQSTAGSAVAFALGGGGGSTSNATLGVTGDTGQHGITYSGSAATGGKGGNCALFGTGGGARVAQANGLAGVGFGSGGSGGVSTAADKTGGNGADGKMLILEFK